MLLLGAQVEYASRCFEMTGRNWDGLGRVGRLRGHTEGKKSGFVWFPREGKKRQLRDLSRGLVTKDNLGELEMEAKGRKESNSLTSMTSGFPERERVVQVLAADTKGCYEEDDCR